LPVNEDTIPSAFPARAQAVRDELRAGDTVQLCSGLAFFPLDDEMVVFSERAQSLIGLNSTAALLVRKLQEGATTPALAAALTAEWGVAPNMAKDWVASTLEALGSHGFLDDSGSAHPLAPAPSEKEEVLARRRAQMPPYKTFEPHVVARYRLLGICALVRYGHKDQMRMVDAVIGHLKVEGPAETNFVIDISATGWAEGDKRHISSNIYCDRQPDAQAMKLSRLGPLVKTALWIKAVNAYDFLLNLHAGVVANGSRCILLPAASGSGKSSLTAALAGGGFGYFSDEVGLIERGTLQVIPVPLAVCVKSTGFDLMSRYYPGITALPAHKRDDGKVVVYVPPKPAEIRREPGFVSHIFFPQYAAGEATRLEPLSRSVAFTRLMDQCVALRCRLDRDTVRDMVRWIGQIDCYALTFSSLDEAVALVRSAAIPE
jgi:hypothetical protein